MNFSTPPVHDSPYIQGIFTFWKQTENNIELHENYRTFLC